MDDLEFRRRIMSDPRGRDRDTALAAAQSEANSNFLDEVLKLDSQIEQAMNVDVPDDLADRILFNQSTQQEADVVPFTRRKARQLTALAASVAFVAGILVGQLNWSPGIITPAYASLADTAVQHVIDETPFINPLDEEVSSRQINMKMKPFAYQFTDNFPYHVYYLNHCGFGDSNALHMVFEGEKGRVTLFVTNLSSGDSKVFDKQGLKGSITPLGNASMILVGEKEEDVAKIAEKLRPIIKPAS